MGAHTSAIISWFSISCIEQLTIHETISEKINLYLLDRVNRLDIELVFDLVFPSEASFQMASEVNRRKKYQMLINYYIFINHIRTMKFRVPVSGIFFTPNKFLKRRASNAYRTLLDP